MALLFFGCAAQTSGVTSQCVVNSDQTTLFMGHWPTHPIPLAVEAGDFSASDLTAIEAAIQTWNSFFSQSKGFQLYLNGTSSLATASAGTARLNNKTVCSQSMVGPNGFSTNIMILKDSSNWTYSSAIMALTSACPITVASSTYKQYVSAVMEINYQDYFNSGQPIPDLQSIVTHELGHMLGLDHSCNGSGCDNASVDYQNAIMYPTIGFNGTAGVVKRDLNDNDEERANCLY